MDRRYDSVEVEMRYVLLVLLTVVITKNAALGQWQQRVSIQRPVSTGDNALVRWDGTLGGAVQSSGWTLADTNVLTAGGNFATTGFISRDGDSEGISIDTTGNVYTTGAVVAGVGSPIDMSNALAAIGSLTRVLVQSTGDGNNCGFRLVADNSSGTTRSSGVYFIPGTTDASTYIGFYPDDGNPFLGVTRAGMVFFSGNTSGYPALKRSSSELQVRQADDSAHAPLTAYKTVTVDTDGGSYTAAMVAGQVYVNTGDADGQTITLPSAAAGMNVTFVCVESQNIKIDVQAGNQILALTSNTGDSITAGTAGNTITLVAVDGVTWAATSIVGTWTDTD